VRESVELSRANLGVDAIDLLQLHQWDDDWLAGGELAETVAELKREGAIRAFGISLNRREPWNGIGAVESGLVDAVQVVYNVFDQAAEDELFPACRENGVAVIARCPFDEGSLTGNLTLGTTWPEGDWRNGYFKPDNLAQSVARADALKPLLPAGMTLADMALRFILSSPDVSAVIPACGNPPTCRRTPPRATPGPCRRTCWPSCAVTAGTARRRSRSRGPPTPAPPAPDV